MNEDAFLAVAFYGCIICSAILIALMVMAP